MKTVCIYHSIDLDGWMSAAIVKHWFIEKSKFIDGMRDESIGQELDFIGYNHGQPIPDLSEYDKVIMVDISFPKEEMVKLWDKLGVENMIWIDHHISAIKDTQDTKWLWEGMQDTKFAACELTWKYFFPNELMPEIVRLLGRYDCFGHKGTNEEIKVLEFQYGARQKISNYEEAYEWLTMCLDHPEIINEIQNAGDEIYEYLCTEAKQSYKNKFSIKLGYKPGGRIEADPLVHGTYKFICINKERFNPINFGIDYHKDGYDGCACFHYANGKWNFSLYNDNGLVDCSVIAKSFGGGGHKGAAGFVVDDIYKIIK